MKFFLFKFFGSMILLTAFTAHAQILPFKTYSVKDGLPANDIEAISQDSYGRMWFGTSDGLSVFDGKSFTNYTVADGLPHNFVTQLVPDARTSGVMWIIAGGAVCRFDGHQFKNYPLPVNVVHAIYPDDSGTTWCGTNRGVFTIVDGSIRQFQAEMLKKDIFAFAEGGQDIMWIAADTALIHYAKHAEKFTYLDINKVPIELKHSDILARIRGEFRSMKVDADGTVWLTNSYSYLFKIVGTRIASERPLFYNTFIYDISQNQVSGYGYDGISTIHKGDISVAPIITTTVNNGLPENSVRSAYVDHEGNSWIGGRDLGVVKLSAGSVLKFPIGEVWAVHNVQFAAADQNDHIWFIARDTLVEFWRDRHERWIQKQHNFYRAKHLFFRGARDYNYYAGVYCDRENRLWLVSLKGPAQVECYQVTHDTSAARDQPSTLELLKRFRLDDDFSDNLTVCFLVSREGILWISLWHKGIMRLDPNTSPMESRIFGETEGVPTNYIRTLYEDQQGNIWGASFNQGAVRITPGGAVQRFTMDNGLPDNSVWCFTEDQLGSVLVGTASGGLAAVEKNAAAARAVEGNLPSNKIYCMTEDFSSRLWLGTKIGMLYEDRPGMKTFVRNQEFIGPAVLAAGVTSDSMLWFFTSKHLWIYNHLKEKRNTHPPPVYITGVIVNGVQTTTVRDVELDYTQNRVEVQYIGISFKDESAVRYLYRIGSATTKWLGPTYSTSIVCGLLEPGSYEFEVKAINIDGTESAQPATFAFEILPPYWKTWWFSAVTIIAALSIGLLIYYYRFSSLKKAQLAQQIFSRQLIESQEAERKRLAGELHDDLGQNMIVIVNSAQMGLRAPSQNEMKVQLNEIVETGSRTIQGIREIAYNLSPYHLEKIGLTESIRGMVQKLAELTGVRFIFDIEILNNILPKELEINIYRIVQECVNNIIKHSSSSEASLLARRVDDSLEIIVRDDGKGFDLPKVSSASHAGLGYGLSGMLERVKLLRGSLDIKTSPGMGTTVTVRIPIPLIKPS